jgi:cysteine desulfurase
MPAGRLYADYNATAPLRPEARAAMLHALEVGGNASSVHAEGRAAKKILEGARELLAQALHVPPQAVTFVSGATEGLHLAMESARALGFAPWVIGAGEHDAAWAFAARLYADPIVIPIARAGDVDLAAFDAVLSGVSGKPLVIVQAVNNETGAINALDRIATRTRAIGGAVLCDATQALGKIDATAFVGFADWLVVSSHKIGGPLGAGAVVTAPGASLVNVRPGGGQELGMRAGTQNMPAIAGFAAAAAACASDAAIATFQDASARERDRFEAALGDAFSDRVVIGAEAPRVANTACVALSGWSAEKQVIGLDLAGAAVSAGAACSSGKVKVSRVLTAAGWDESLASCAIRASFGWASAHGDGERLALLYIKAARGRRPAAKEN